MCCGYHSRISLENIQGDDPKRKFAAMLKIIEYGGLGNGAYASGYEKKNQQGQIMDWAIAKLNNQEHETTVIKYCEEFL